VLQTYRWFTDDGLSESEIAARLNEQGVRTDLGRDWTRATVREVLSNEKYIGNNSYNRRSFKLKKLRVVNTPINFGGLHHEPRLEDLHVFLVIARIGW